MAQVGINNTFIKDHAASGRMVVEFSRNPKDFRLPNYIQIKPVTKQEGYYLAIDALQAGQLDRIAALIHNDLEPAALALLPELELTLAAAEKYGALRAFVSGSGPTVAALVENFDDAIALQTALRHANFDAFATTSSPLGAQVEQGEEA